MRQESWSRRNRDRVLFAVGLIAVAAGVIWFFWGQAEGLTAGKMVVPADWRMPDSERLGSRYLSGDATADWGRGRDIFRQGSGPSVNPYADVEMPPAPPPLRPLPKAAIGALPALRPAVEPVVSPKPAEAPKEGAKDEGKKAPEPDGENL